MNAVNTPSYGFSTFFKSNGLYYFQFNDDIGEPILFSYGYPSEKSRDHGMKMVAQNAIHEANYETFESGKGQFFFTLKSEANVELGRSRLFNSKEELEAKRDYFRKSHADKALDQFKEPKLTTSSDQLASNSSIGIVQKVVEQSKQEEKNGQMPRYKFSVIYYPDTGKWVVKPEFIPDSNQFESNNGKQIGDFLRSQLPSTQKGAYPNDDSPKKKKEGINVDTENSLQKNQEKLMLESQQKTDNKVILKIRGVYGEEVRVTTRIDNLLRVEILPEFQHGISNTEYHGIVEAQSLDNKKSIVIGQVSNQTPTQGYFTIPITNNLQLKPGMYRFTATVQHGTPTNPVNNYQANRLIMLN